MAQASPKKSVYDDPPRKQVLLLSCMDTRLLDNVVAFMDKLNLQNRYDHVIFAGAAMGAALLKSPMDASSPQLPWKAVFFDHLLAAIDTLHRDIKDIFLLEHLDCGAYKYLHPDSNVQAKYKKQRDLSKLRKYHRREARQFGKEIKAFCKDRHATTGNDAWKGIRIRCLLMDLTGHVTDL